jgi:hypothetical protein
VQVTSEFDFAYGFQLGGPWSYSVDSDGTFSGTVAVDYFEISGNLIVNAVDSGSNQSASANIQVPAGG